MFLNTCTSINHIRGRLESNPTFAESEIKIDEIIAQDSITPLNAVC